MLDAPTTRRGVLGAAALAAIPVPALAIAPAQGASPALLSLIDQQERAEAEWSAYREAAFEPMQEASFAELRLVPHETTIAAYCNGFGADHRFTTEGWQVASARRVIEDAAHVKPDILAAAQECVSMAEVRGAKIAEIEERHRVAEIEARDDELMDVATDALRAVLAFPSTSIADVLAKMAFISRSDSWELSEAHEGLEADLRRLGMVGPAA